MLLHHFRSVNSNLVKNITGAPLQSSTKSKCKLLKPSSHYAFFPCIGFVSGLLKNFLHAFASGSATQ